MTAPGLPAALVPVPRAGAVLLVVPDGGDRVGFVLVSTEQLCSSPDAAWAVLRGAWIRLRDQLADRPAAALRRAESR